MITQEHLRELNDIIKRAKEHVEHLSDFEIIFLHDWESRLNNKGENVVVSDKQSFIFEVVYRKLSQLWPSVDLRDHDDNCKGDFKKIDMP